VLLEIERWPADLWGLRVARADAALVHLRGLN
jgi:hypothetical protein